MPILTNKQFVEFFWTEMDIIKNNSKSVDSNHQYAMLLFSILDISKKLIGNVNNVDADKAAGIRDNLPLLAMISEIQLIAPDVVKEASLHSKSIKKAVSILDNYSFEKRQFLKEHFLAKEQADIYRFDDYRK